MVNTCCGEKSKCGIIAMISTIVSFVALFAVFIAGITIVSTPYDFENLPYFADTQCTPSAVLVVKMPLCDATSDAEGGTNYYDEYVAIWKCQETGATILENPFAGNRQEQIAKNSINDFPLQVTQNVSCNTKNPPIQYPGWKNFFQCQVWNTCFFDTDMIEDLQANAYDRYQRGYHLLYASAGLFVLTAICFTILMMDVCECFGKQQYI